MLSGVAPGDMDVVRGRLNFEKYVTVTDEFSAILARMLEPIDDDRAQTVDDLVPPEPEPEPEPEPRALVPTNRSKLVPIASTSANVVQFRDPANTWVDIESRDEGQRLDRYVRAFPFETRMILQPDVIRLERRVSPFGWKVVVAMCVVILGATSTLGSTFVYLALPILILLVIRLFRIQSVEVSRLLSAADRKKLTAEIFVPNVGTFPISEYQGTRASKRGVEVSFAGETYDVPIYLEKPKHQYFAERFDAAVQHIQNHEELDPLDIW